MLSSSLIFLVISTGTKTHVALKMHGERCLSLFPLSQSADPQLPSTSNAEHAQPPAAVRSAPLWGPDYHPGISLFNLSPFISCSCFSIISHSLPVNSTLIHSFSQLFFLYLYSLQLLLVSILFFYFFLQFLFLVRALAFPSSLLPFLSFSFFSLFLPKFFQC